MVLFPADVPKWPCNRRSNDLPRTKRPSYLYHTPGGPGKGPSPSSAKQLDRVALRRKRLGSTGHACFPEDRSSCRVCWLVGLRETAHFISFILPAGPRVTSKGRFASLFSAKHTRFWPPILLSTDAHDGFSPMDWVVGELLLLLLVPDGEGHAPDLGPRTGTSQHPRDLRRMSGRCGCASDCVVLGGLCEYGGDAGGWCCRGEWHASNPHVARA